MNDHQDSFPEPGDDPILDELLSHLKRLEPPVETRIANRMAIAAELSSLRTVNQQRHLPWWRRSVSIPAPLAACLVLLTAFVLLSRFHGSEKRLPTEVVAPVQPMEAAADVKGEQAAIAKQTSDRHAVLEYYETETYLCGIGRLNSESGYFIKE
jgi:hypothetical protein